MSRSIPGVRGFSRECSCIEVRPFLTEIEGKMGFFSPFSLVFVDLNIPKGGGMKGSGAYHSLDRERVAPNGENPES
jgi:hypothetical protein